MAPPEEALTFPCSFPIKVMGESSADFEAHALELVRRHAPDVDASAISRRPSRAGHYVSLTITITATSRAQLDAIYRDLTACEQVLVAL